MKIAYIVEDYYVNGGVERIVSEKANVMASEWGHEVTLVSVYRDTPRRTYPLDGSVRLVLLDVPMAAKGAGPCLTAVSRAATLVKAARRLNLALRRLDPDVIFFTTALGALLLPFYHGRARKIYESHSARSFTPYHRMFFLTELKADAVVCLTEGDAREYKRAKRVEVIPNFVYQPERRAADYSVKRAVAVGRLEEQKGFDIMIDCWKAAAADTTGWRLDIYGAGPLHASLQRRITALGLDGSVTLKGRCEEMTERYADYSLHLMTSRYEGLPMTLIEAQAAGLPSVVTDFKYGARDIIRNGHNGIITPQGDTAAFARALSRMAGDERLRAEYGANAAAAADKFGKEKIMEEWKKKFLEGW